MRMNSAAAESPRRTASVPGGKLRDRIANDAYFTLDPMPVAELLSHLTITGRVLEPCAGAGHIVRELRKAGHDVVASDLHGYGEQVIDDIAVGRDVLRLDSLTGFSWIVTNLPYDHQDDIARRLLPIAHRDGCGVALLVRAPWPLARSRRDILGDDIFFKGMIVLPRRPRWFETTPGEKAGKPFHEYVWTLWGSSPRGDGVLPNVYFPKYPSVLSRS